MIKTDKDFCFLCQVGTFPNAVHALCYYHLHLQNWLKFIAKWVPENDTAKKYARWASEWIRSWFFEVETKAEYDDSKTKFYDWLASVRTVISEPCYDAIRDHVLKKLYPHEEKWVNYQRLFMLGYSEKCTSIGEGLHASMKAGQYKVDGRMSIDQSAMAMVDKAESKGRKKSQKNAAQLSRTKLWSQSETSGDLVKNAEITAEEYHNLSKKVKLFAIERGKWLAFTMASKLNVCLRRGCASILGFDIKLDVLCVF